MKANRIAITSIATVATIGIGIAAIFGFNAANDGERIDDASTPSEAWDTVYDTPFDQHRTEPDTRPIADVNDNKVPDQRVPQARALRHLAVPTARPRSQPGHGAEDATGKPAHG
jgi:hypothetical protein